MDGGNNARVITWGDTGNNSQWKFILLEENETNAAKEELLELSKKTLTLVNEVATVSYNEGSKITLQSDDNTAVNYIWSNAAVSGNNVDKLLDGNKDSFFHSQWGSTTAPSDGWGHHLTVDLGDTPSLTSFKFKFTTRNESGLSNYPKTIEVYGSNIGGDDVANYTKLQVTSGFATGAGVDNEAVVMGNGTAYRYLRFLVTDASGGNSGTNTGSDGKVFFHMSEFSLYPITVTTSVKSDYTSVVTSDAVMNAFVDAEQAKSVYNNASATIDDINAKKTALGDGTAAGSYTTLLNQYNSVLNSVLVTKKAQLQQLINETNTLIASVGSVTITPPAENELSLQVDNANGSYYLSTNSQESGDNRNIKNLLDGVTDNADVYFHTDWNASVGADHHLLLDMGEGNSLGTFTFKYTTRNTSSSIDAPATIVVEGSNDNSSFTTIETLTGLPTGQHETYTSKTLGTNQNKYRYVRFRVTDGAGKVDGSYYYFAMSEFDVAEVTETKITVANNSSVVEDDMLVDTYLATAKSQNLLDAETTVALLDAAIADQQAAKDKLYAAMNNTAALKANLKELIDNTQALYDKMADDEGNVNSNYSVSALENQDLVDALAQITAAQLVFENASATVENINTAYETLNEKYQVLLEVENANVATTIDKSGLRTAITNANDLVAAIETKGDGYYESVAGFGLAELSFALQNAETVVDRFYLTEEQYTEAFTLLNNCYTTTNGIFALDCNSENRNNLAALIGNVNTLLTTIADEGEITYAIPLQATNNTEAFYIWCNDPASDSQGVAGLIDKNADGTANTGTFLGSDWGSDVPAYTHYIEVDLGATVTLDQLTMDYTTRNSTHADQRPNAIKILGSNDKVNYTEITEITSGLAAEANEQWSMAESLDLCGHYRYIRVAVGSQRGFFHMADFNLYTKLSHTLKEYYTTAEGLDFTTLCFVLDEAKDAAAHYMTTEQYTAVYNKLSGCYTTADAVVDNDYTERGALETLIGDAATLISEVATVTEVVTPVLSTANVYCNADNSTNSGANDNDKLGVAALFDNDVTTHLHTTYGNNAQDDDLDHYIRVDMGEDKAVAAFEFSYTGRNADSNNDPSVMVIQGCNTLDGEWEEIKTLTGLPTEGDKVQYASGLIEARKSYRYIRFMVTETQNNSFTTYNGKNHKFFVMSEFGFTAYPTVEVDENYPRVTTALVRAAYNEKNSANNVATNYYMTESDYNAALAALKADYDALDAAATADKSELEALIEATTILKGQLYETVITSYTANEVTLSITEGDAGYIYCNAPEKNSGWATDNAGVVALIDLTDGGEPNLDTFLHTEYGNDQSADGLDHYLRVDLGAGGATEYIEFGYVGRSGHLSKSPKTVIVAATNDLNGEWTTIKTLTMAEPSATAETKTGALGNGNDYRYWRFMVTENHSGGTDGNGHPYFALTDFNVYKCTDIVKDEQLKYTPNIYIYTTSVLVTEVENAISAATTVKDDAEALQPAVNAAVEALQAVYDKLAEAINYYWCPVELTVDVANPALYTIDAIGRDEGKAWQYNAQNNNITIVNKDASNLYHLWYFMLGGEEQTVKIIPVMTPEYGLSATDFTNGVDKVSAVAENCVNWSFAYVNNNYNFKPHGRNIYLSNYNGGSNPLGFYGSADGGSYVNFTAVEVEDYALTRLAKLAEGKNAVTAGTTVGSYDEATCGVYNEALEAANGMVAAASSMPQDYVNAFTRLFNANNGLRINLPDPAKFYALRCNHESRYIYVNADNKLQWAASSYDKSQSNAVWVFEEVDDLTGTCKMKSLHTQSYLSGTSDSQWAFGEEGKVVTLVKSPSVEGALVFKVDGYENNGLHAHGANNTVISHTNDADANHYFFEEVEDVTSIKHNVTMNAVFSSVTLGYNTTVPAGVEAYNAEGLKDGYVTLVKVAGEGEVIPENTPIILYRTDDEKTKTFNYTNATAIKPSESLLGGSLYTKYVKCDDSDYYKLMIKSGEAKMYLMYKEFNAEGVSQGATHAGGHIKCSANKIYMRVPAAQGVASYGMRFVDYGTTDIDDAKGENQDAETIYDLQGRKLSEITEPGFYIVDVCRNGIGYPQRHRSIVQYRGHVYFLREPFYLHISAQICASGRFAEVFGFRRYCFGVGRYLYQRHAGSVLSDWHFGLYVVDVPHYLRYCFGWYRTRC